MRLSRISLEKEGRRAILQGMIHIGSETLYSMFQRDVDWASAQRYRIFFEGVRKEGKQETEGSTSDRSRIGAFFLLINELLPGVANALGISLQKEKIKYPPDAINADITFDEFTQRLDENGFRCDFLLKLLRMVDKDSLQAQIANKFKKQGGLNELMEKAERPRLGKLVRSFFFRKAMPVILDHRNRIAATIIRSQSNGHNILIHYGEKHVSGLVQLLQQDGWKVKETTYTDLAVFS